MPANGWYIHGCYKHGYGYNKHIVLQLDSVYSKLSLIFAKFAVFYVILCGIKGFAPYWYQQHSDFILEGFHHKHYQNGVIICMMKLQVLFLPKFQEFSPSRLFHQSDENCVFTISIIGGKGVFRYLNLKMIKIDNEVHFLKLFFLQIIGNKPTNINIPYKCAD